MDAHDREKEAVSEASSAANSPPNPDNFKDMLALGEQVVRLVNDIADLVRMETMLAIQSIPRLLMLWFLMMPILLLTWCSFSAWIAWMLYAATQLPGAGFFAFFLQQLLLLFVCRWLYTKYRQRMTLPYTREHIDKFLRGFNNGSPGSSETKK
ncbi:MAG: hypothetical protein B0W54_05390 [Cellvibrio sp. 79]|nr:MAG: hypothetical protein B0W54_05390 [Cellvibrio sp. 79]